MRKFRSAYHTHWERNLRRALSTLSSLLLTQQSNVRDLIILWIYLVYKQLSNFLDLKITGKINSISKIKFNKMNTQNRTSWQISNQPLPSSSKLSNKGGEWSKTRMIHCMMPCPSFAFVRTIELRTESPLFSVAARRSVTVGFFETTFEVDLLPSSTSHYIKRKSVHISRLI